MVDLNRLKDLDIVYVEDDERVQKQTKMVLDDFLHEVITANDGLEGLKKIKEHSPDIIITDIMMPNMNGIEMLKALKNDGITTPTIITTAHNETEYLLSAIELKVGGYILKPINVKNLISTIYDIALPKFQQKELEGCENIINSIASIVGGKKIEILQYIINNLDENDMFYSSYYDIMEKLDVSKPTVINFFKQLIDNNIITKEKNKVYKFNKDILREKAKGEVK